MLLVGVGTGSERRGSSVEGKNWLYHRMPGEEDGRFIKVFYVQEGIWSKGILKSPQAVV